MIILNIIYFLISVIGYPLLILGGLVYLQYTPTKVAALCLLLLLIQLAIKIPELKKQFKSFIPLSCGLFIIYLLSYYFNNEVYMKLTPIFISLYFLIIFLFSLIYPPSMIERFARLKEKELPHEAISYCFNVTKIWIAFFILNITIAIWTVFQDIKIWAIYNGLISYILMGTLFTTEWLYRHFVIQKNIKRQSNKNV